MSDVLIEQDTMEDIGDAIREKLGVSDTYLPASMPAAIRSISGGGSGGGSAKYSETVLWENSSGSSFKPENPVTITLSDSISNYEMLAFIFSTNADRNYRHTSIMPVSCIEKNGNYFNTTALGGHVYNAPVCGWISDTSIKLYGYSSSYPMVCYKVIGIKWETMQTALIYSEEEREVGVWTDGKPLYQKTVIGNTAITSKGWVILWEDANIDTIAGYECYFFQDIWLTQTDYYYTSGEQVRVMADTSGNLAVSGNKCVALQKGNAQTITATRLTVRYTKTTDTPGSGIWTTTGEYAHHYSTDEKVVGTWIDGKTLYEKTLTGLNISATAAWGTQITLISNIDTIVDIKAHDQYGLRAVSCQRLDANTFNFKLEAGTATIMILTLQYTKTT